MKVSKTSLDGVLMIEPSVFEDNRGFFMETYHRKRYTLAGITTTFVQDNFSFSKQGTLRGLHYQYPNSQAKLVQVIYGEVFDVAVDICRGSPTFGKSEGVYLSGENKRQLFIPEGFAHGFVVLSERAFVLYKCSDFYTPEHERGVLWSDPDLSIDWSVKAPLISEKDSGYPRLKDIPPEQLPFCRGEK